MKLLVCLSLHCALLLLAVKAEQNSDGGPQDYQEADQRPAENKKDKRGLFGSGSVFGYDPFTPAPYAVYGSTASAPGLPPGLAPGLAPGLPPAHHGLYGYSAAAPAPYSSYQAGYAPVITKVTYAPYAGPGAAYVAYTDGVYSKLSGHPVGYQAYQGGYPHEGYGGIPYAAATVPALGGLSGAVSYSY